MTDPVQVAALGSTVVEVSAGEAHTCARTRDGTLWCWGDNDDGQLGINSTDTPQPEPVQVVALGNTVVEVSVGKSHNCARKSDGTLWCWGRNTSGALGIGSIGSPQLVPVQVTALADGVIGVSAGARISCAGTDEGLWCWGYNEHGQVGDGSTDPRPNPTELDLRCR
jgi:alpha-tubulin suppressor-like RCC1 family protein